MLPVTEVRIDALEPYPRNYRHHPEAQVARIARALERYGQYKNIVVHNGVILAGHGVVEGARAAGRETVGVVDVSHLSETEAVALLAWDNESPRGAVDAEDVLASLVAELAEADAALAELAAGTEERLAELLASVGGGEANDDNETENILTRANVPDALWPSDNEWGIPSLDVALQAKTIDLPVALWGAVGRKKRMRGTWVFYCDDYRFEALWSDPSGVVNTRCVSVVEPNFTIGPQTPRAVALWQIYRKRYLARWWQSCGVRVLVDVNVDATTFGDIMLLGVPRGWRAYATRGYTERLDFTVAEYELACEHAGTDNILFLLYGGGKACQGLAQERSWIYVSEHMDVKRGGYVDG